MDVMRSSHCNGRKKCGNDVSTAEASSKGTCYDSATVLSVIDFKYLVWPCVLVPFAALWTCFFIAVFFQFDEVNDTVCKIRNTIPSISAICSTVPNRYIWRMAVALHITPRLYIGLLYYQYYIRGIHTVPMQYRGVYKLMILPNLILYLLENLCLTGTAYVNNREDYPLHEKLFIFFMMTSILYMLTSSIMFTMSKYKNNCSKDQVSLKLKYMCSTVILAATIALLYYFYKHSVYCEEGAFSMFSFWEYWIAMSNMGFHLTASLDFKEYKIVFTSSGGENHHISSLVDRKKQK